MGVTKSAWIGEAFGVRLSFLALSFLRSRPRSAIPTQAKKRRNRQPHSKTLARLTERPLFWGSCASLITTSPVLPTIEQRARATVQQRHHPELGDQSSRSHSPPLRAQIDLRFRPRKGLAAPIPCRAQAFAREA